MRRLLFLSPVMPDPDGQGLAMRAALFVDALVRDAEVHLLVVPVAEPAADGHVPDFTAKRVARVEWVDPVDALDSHFALIGRAADRRERLEALAREPRPFLCRYTPERAVQAAARRFAGTRFDALHVLRLYMAPYAKPWQGRVPSLLDADECDSRMQRRLAHTARDPVAAEAARIEAEKLAQMERHELGLFDAVLCCSDVEAEALARACPGARFEVIPNALPGLRKASAADVPAFDFLIAGSFGHGPNHDGAEWFVREAWPRLRQQLPDATLGLVGRDAPPELQGLDGRDGVTVTGCVDDVGAYRRRARVAVAPLRAAAGTQYKILEAWAAGLPVVTTPVGAEGLGARDGRELCIADGADALADACRRAGTDETLRARLVAGARRRMENDFARGPVQDRIRACWADVVGP